MKATRVLLLTLLSLVALPLVAQVNDTYVIPVSVNSHGAFGSNWKTQLNIFNPQLDRDLVVTIAFLPTGGLKGDAVTVTVPKNAMAFSDNILDDLQFNQASSGALLVYTDENDNRNTTILQRSFLVTSNTYNDLGADGTYGQTIPGIWTGLQNFNTDGISGVSHGIRNIASQGWRTNVGAVNLGRCNADLLVSVYDADGNTLLDRERMTLPPLGHLQQALPIGNVDRGSVEFMVDDPCANNSDNAAVVFAYTSTIDNLSGDPQYQSPVLLADPHSLFAQTIAAMRAADPQAQPGKKIDNGRAQQVRAASNFRGETRLVRAASGWRITR